MTRPRVAVVLGGGAARGLAHIGVLEVLEREGVEVDFAVGSSMGGLVAALLAAGLRPAEMRDLARGFRFPWWFVPGGLVPWDRIFAPAVPALEGATFDSLRRGLAVVAVDLESGRRVVLREGPVLPAIRATCAVPAVLPPVQIDGRWLVDGALLSVLPVDVASLAQADVVVAVEVGARRASRLPRLARSGWRLGTLLPNPLTARSSFEILVRASEIALDRQNTLAAAMVGPEVLVRVDLGDLGMREFDRLEEAVAAGRRAMEAELPALRKALASRPSSRVVGGDAELKLDPVCDMVVSPARAAAALQHEGRTVYFCSTGCRDLFVRDATARAAHG